MKEEMNKKELKDMPFFSLFGKNHEACLVSRIIKEESEAISQYEEKLQGEISEDTKELIEEALADEKDHVAMFSKRLEELDKVKPKEYNIEEEDEEDDEDEEEDDKEEKDD